MKMITAGFVAHRSGSFLFSSFRPPISVRKFGETQFQLVKISGTPLQTPLRHSFPVYRHIKCASTGRNGHQGLFSEDRFDQEPFWLTMIKDTVWSLKSLAIFLAEQPSQLKYIEWPTFQSTLKTATLTLVLVALLIVALTSIDSFLCYILALLLRKTA